MPIYEYERVDPQKACPKCTKPFELIQALNEEPLNVCPACGGKVRKVVSWCRAAVIDIDQSSDRVEKQISNYEKQGKWSHAAELADKQADKAKDRQLLTRALDNYKKAGYDTKTLQKHSDSFES
jgi:putative FmdB family regulatory protein